MKLNRFLPMVVAIPVITAPMLLHQPASKPTQVASTTQQEAPQSDDSGDGSTMKPPSVQAEIHAVTVTPTPTPTPAPTPEPTPIPDVQSIIIKWANYYGVDAEWMLRVAYCESRYDPGAINLKYSAGGGNPSGIFQFLPDTFYGFAAEMGLQGAYIWNIEHQAQVAAWAFANGRSGNWECQ